MDVALEYVNDGKFEYGLHALGEAKQGDCKYWNTKGLCYLGLYKRDYSFNLQDVNLVRAKDCFEEALKVAKGTRWKVEVRLNLCSVLELQGKFEDAAEEYGFTLVSHAKYSGLNRVRFKASQAYKRVDMVDEAIECLQYVMDESLGVYNESDMMLLVALAYESSLDKGARKVGREAYKEAYKKARELGMVKYGESTEQDMSVGHKHVSMSEWKDDVETWVLVAEKCLAAGDVLYALDLYTKALWTRGGQEDASVWMKFGELSVLFGDMESGVQSAATAFNMLPMDLEIRSTLGRWDPVGWGAHLGYEDWVVTKMQAILRGNWGRLVAAEHKKVVLAERARRRKGAIEIQRVTRGVQGRGKALRRREEIAAEIAAYEQWLLETASASVIQRCWRCFRSKRCLAIFKKEFVAARTIQCGWRCFAALAERRRLRGLRQEMLERRGAVHMQRVVRGYLCRLLACFLGAQRDGAIGLQRLFRGFRVRGCFQVDISYYRGATGMQRVFRGWRVYSWYKNLRGNSSTRIQTAYRRHMCLLAYRAFKVSMARYNSKARSGFMDAFVAKQQLNGDDHEEISPQMFVSDAYHSGVSEILSWLQANPREARTLWICNRDIGIDGMESLASQIQSNESLRELGLGRGCNIGVRGASVLAEALRCHNFRFEKLYINDQQDLGDYGIKHIMNTIGDFFFGRYSRLEQVNLRNNNIGDESCRVLAEGLALNEKLRALELQDNRIGDQGACHLSVAFQRNETLLHLNLSGNRIGSSGAAALALVVGRSKLELLDLNANFIQTTGAVAIIKCLKKHKHLRIFIKANPVQHHLLLEVKSLCSKVEVKSLCSKVGLAEGNLSTQPQRDLTRSSTPPQKEDDTEIRLELPPVQVKKRQRPSSPYLAPPWANYSY